MRLEGLITQAIVPEIEGSQGDKYALLYDVELVLRDWERDLESFPHFKSQIKNMDEIIDICAKEVVYLKECRFRSGDEEVVTKEIKCWQMRFNESLAPISNTRID